MMAMRHYLSILLALVLVGLLSSCVVRTQPGHSHRRSHKKACPPAHHWDGYDCVHNSRKGKGRGRR
jgi:hypothetical protein